MLLEPVIPWLLRHDILLASAMRILATVMENKLASVERRRGGQEFKKSESGD